MTPVEKTTCEFGVLSMGKDLDRGKTNRRQKNYWKGRLENLLITVHGGQIADVPIASEQC